MFISTVPLAGLDLSAIIAVVPNTQAASIVTALERLLRSPDPTPLESTTWEPLSRSVATMHYPNAWDAPAWSAHGATDVARMAWVRGHLSEALTTGFDHLVSLRGARTNGTELSQLVGFETPGGWKSALSHAAMYCRRVSRQPIWDAELAGGAFQYWMTSDVAELWSSSS